MLIGWSGGAAGTGAEQRLLPAGVKLGWSIVNVGTAPVTNRAEIIASLNHEQGRPEVSFTFHRPVASTLGPIAAPPSVDGALQSGQAAWSGGNTGVGCGGTVAGGGRTTPYPTGRLVSFETLPQSGSMTAMSSSMAASGEAQQEIANRMRTNGRDVLTALSVTPKLMGGLERELGALLKEQEADVEVFERLRLKFEAEVSKLAEEHEKNYERAVKKDQKKGTGRHSADKWCTAAASEVRACEAKYVTALRERADRVLRNRRLVAELYASGMETIQVRTGTAFVEMLHVARLKRLACHCCAGETDGRLQRSCGRGSGGPGRVWRPRLCAAANPEAADQRPGPPPPAAGAAPAVHARRQGVHAEAALRPQRGPAGLGVGSRRAAVVPV